MTAVVTVGSLGRTFYTSENQKVFKNAALLLHGLLNKMPGSGTYTLVPRDKTKWKPQHGEKMCLRPSQGRDIRIRIKPGDGGTCWEYSLQCGPNLDHEVVREFLEGQLGPETTDTNHEVVAQTPPTNVDNATSILERMVAVMQRVKLRSQERASLSAKISDLQKEIDQLQSDKDDLQLKLMEIDEAEANDKEARVADKLAELLSGN